MVNRFKRFSYLITETYRYMRKIENEEMSKLGLKGGYAAYLLALHGEDEGLTSARLGELCGRNKADVSRAIADRSEKGLVKRFSSPHNYRTPIVLTEIGEAHANALATKVKDTILRVSRGIPESVISDFYDAIALICDGLKEISESGLDDSEAID